LVGRIDLLSFTAYAELVICSIPEAVLLAWPSKIM
jgi:hypothetical protein